MNNRSRRFLSAAAVVAVVSMLIGAGCATGDFTLTLDGAKSYVAYHPDPSPIHIDASAAIEATHTISDRDVVAWRTVANAEQRMAVHRQAVAEVLKDDLAKSGLFTRIVPANNPVRPDYMVSIRSELRRVSGRGIRITMSLHDGRSGAELWRDVQEAGLVDNGGNWGQPAAYHKLMNLFKTELGTYLQHHPRGEIAAETPLPTGGYLGVDFRDMTVEEARAGQLPENQGVLITRVVAPGPAAKAELPVGSLVVTWDGQPVTTAADLQARCQQLAPGQKVNLKFVREGKTQSTTVTAGALPAAIAHFRRGLQRRENGDYLGAIADFNEFIRVEPANALGYFNRGMARASCGKMKEAIADYTEVIRLDPANAFAHLNRGLAKAYEGDYAGAIPDYTEAIRLNPAKASGYAYRASARTQMGDAAGAAQDQATAAALEAKATAARLQVEFAHAALPDLLTASDPNVTAARARNRAIVAAKTTQLPELLRDTATNRLTALVVKIEQAILDLNHECEVAKDRAQKAIAGGPDQVGGVSPDDLRELSLSYRERIELLKPIAAAIKEEIANRNR